ncbi:Condensin-2 complex subunit D3 [Mactra antiquata]
MHISCNFSCNLKIPEGPEGSVLPFGGWVKTAWDSDFSEVESGNEEVLVDIDITEITDVLNRLIHALKSLAPDDSSDGNYEISLIVKLGIWVVLVENDISVKTLIAYLSYFILNGHKKDGDATQKELGILACRTYISLNLAPGSQAFKIFHPELYEKSVDYLKQFISLGCRGNTKRKRDDSASNSSGNKRNPKSRKKRSSDDSSADHMEDIISSQDVDDDDDDVSELAPQEINKLRKSLHVLIQDLVLFLEKFSLRQSLSSAHHSIQVIASLTSHEPDSFDGNFESKAALQQLSVPALAFRCLKALCSQLHGHASSLINTTCKCLLPNLLMLIKDKPVQNINKSLQTSKDHAAGFIRLLMKQCGDRGHTSFRTLLQHMCTKVTDRAEYRNKVAQSVVDIANDMPTENYCKMVQWFSKLSKHSKISNRGFALEIVSALLSSPERQITGEIDVALQSYVSHRSLFNIILERCSDKAPVVRTRAIGCFTQCLNSPDEHVTNKVREMMTPQLPVGRPVPRLIRTPGPHNEATYPEKTSDGTTIRTEVTIAQQTCIEGSVMVQDDGRNVENQTPLQRINLTPGFDPNLSDSEGVFSMLRRRTCDQKVNVRKVALQAVEAALRFEKPNFSPQNIEVLREHCRDPGLSARKQSLQSLTDLLIESPDNVTLQTNWLLGALPLVIDRETTLSEKSMELLEDIILSNIVIPVRSISPAHHLAWNLLEIIARPESVNHRQYLSKACHYWSRKGKIKPSIITALESHIGSDNNTAAWMLLSEIAPAAPKINHSFVLNYWNDKIQNETCTDTLIRILTVMKYIGEHLSSDDRTKLIDDLQTRLMNFNSIPELIPVTVSTLSKLCTIESKKTGDTSLGTTWCNDLLMACDKYLSKVALQHDGKVDDENKVICYLCTLGEVVLLSPGKVSKRIFLLVQSMIARPCITPVPPSQSQPTTQDGGSQSQPITQDGATQSQPTAQDGDDQPQPSSHNDGNQSKDTSHNSSSETDCSKISQGSLGSQGSQPLTQFRGSVMSARIRAFAFVNLGKLCLQNEGFAKKCIAALARELEVSKDPAIRNNVMIVMCDLCVRYTTITNLYIPVIATCLKDPSALVRKQTLTLITRLLQEDFIKWKESLFYTFISSLVDDNEEIQQFGEFCLVHMLLKRHPNMLFQHFMECLFYFNDYREHSVYNIFPQSDKEREMFSLKGGNHTKKRLKLYLFLLEHMTDDHRFKLQSKVVQEILGGVVDGILPVNTDTTDILKDALTILSSKEIKLSSLKVGPADDGDDEQEMAAAVMAVAKKTLITMVLKKNVIENIVPVVVSLKYKLSKERSPLLKNLFLYLRELMKDYKTEVNEVLSADKQLASEIEYDLRQFEEEQQREIAATRQPNIVTSVQGTPPQGSPRTPGTVTPQSVRSARPTMPLLRPGILSPRSAVGTRTPPVKKVGPSTKTPAGAPLSTLAVLNSARRMITQQVPSDNISDEANNMTDVFTKSCSTTPQRNKPSGTTEENGAIGVTPRHNIHSCTDTRYRAISTPSVAVSNITFHGDANMTCMPPSPIAESESEQRLYNDDTSLLDDDITDKGNVLHVKSPFNEVNNPRMWNVSSPGPKKASSNGNDEGDGVAGTEKGGKDGGPDHDSHVDNEAPPEIPMGTRGTRRKSKGNKDQQDEIKENVRETRKRKSKKKH